jgi:CSLREA domain-containing protein
LRRLTPALTALAALVVLVLPSAASAQVTTFVDGDDGVCGAQCTLREAVKYLSGTAVITLQPGTYDLERSGAPRERARRRSPAPATRTTAS